MSDFETRARHAADAVRRQIAELPTYDDEGIRRAQRPPSRGPLRLAVAASILIGAVAIGVPVLRAGIVLRRGECRVRRRRDLRRSGRRLGW